ncbi:MULTISPECIES: M67 family metallopeptidase [Kordiimonas]|jgi:proteasome lid subunit RPN8/RPN11|uniref:M67 family metallopeptidase n=1 Tax=Kordiimonas TaxID=288021 RepID=UPI00257EF83B|nr:M67 family metallopeptidase [Kordiimonas sp. UBA4487]
MAGQVNVRLSATLLEMLERTAWQAEPHEACALLLGEVGGSEVKLTQAVVTDNVTEGNPETSFEIDPGMHILMQKAARAGGPQIVGVWHSHPNGVAWPSDTDRAQSVEPGWVWLISGVRDGMCEHGAFRAGTGDPHQLDECMLKVSSD